MATANSLKRLPRVIFAAFLLCSSFAVLTPGTPLRAETPDKSSRKLITKVAPEYPPDLKRARIGGTVKLNVIVNASGTVEDISVAGGNPVLAEYASRAVKKWKYVPADAKSNLHVSIEFDPFH